MWRAPLSEAIRAVEDVAFPLDDLGGAKDGVMRAVVRQFDDARGNKKKKLDLEAAFVTKQVATTGGDELLVALGSGSSPRRERIVLIEEPSSAPRVSLVDASAFYTILRDELAFSGSELNIEGAALDGDDVVLLQRGNGAPTRTPAGIEIAPVDATARVPLASLIAFLRSSAAPPALRDVVAWDLGLVNGHRLTFTDGVTCPRRTDGTVAFLACAEDSPDATRDGPVSAVAIGSLDDHAKAGELGLILDERGEPLLDKAEGLSFDPVDPKRGFVVTDRDDPDAPSELLELRLGPAWTRARA